MKKIITISSIGRINPMSSYRTVKNNSNKKKLKKIRNNPRRKGRVYND